MAYSSLPPGVCAPCLPQSVGAHFSAVWKEYQLHQLKAGMREELLRKGISPDDVRQAFDEFDEDGNGLIDLKEFSQFITRVLKLRLSRPEISTLWRSIDIDGLGEIDFGEFCGTLFPDRIPDLAPSDPALSSESRTADSDGPKEGKGGAAAGGGGRGGGGGQKAGGEVAELTAALGRRLQSVEDRMGSMDTQLEMMRSISVQVLEMMHEVHAEVAGSNSGHGGHGKSGRGATRERSKSRSASPSLEQRERTRKGGGRQQRTQRADTREKSGSRVERGSWGGSASGRKPHEDEFFDMDISLARNVPGAATRDRPASRPTSRNEHRERSGSGAKAGGHSMSHSRSSTPTLHLPDLES